MGRRSALRKEALMGSLTKKILGEYVSALVIETKYGVFAVDVEDYSVGRQLRTNGVYEPEEVELLLSMVKPDSRVLIVGTHIGTVAIPIAKKCKEVVGIEANPNTQKILAYNIAMNGVTNMTVHPFAASDEEGSIEFLLSRANSGGSKRVPKKDDFMYSYDKPETISVKSVRLDDLLDDRSFDTIIMDIEGSEYYALRGMPEILKGAQRLIVEYIPHHLANVADVSPKEWLEPILPHFTTLIVPSRGDTVSHNEILPYLTAMFETGAQDNGLIFEK